MTPLPGGGACCDPCPWILSASCAEMANDSQLAGIITIAVQYRSTVIGDRVPTSALASEPRAHEGAQRA